jgi:hypothetical protein
VKIARHYYLYKIIFSLSEKATLVLETLELFVERADKKCIQAVTKKK